MAPQPVRSNRALDDSKPKSAHICPRTLRWFLDEEGTGEVRRRGPCKGWRCRPCAWRKAAKQYVRISRGVLTAWEADLHVYRFTLTFGCRCSSSRQALRAFAKVVRNLRRTSRGQPDRTIEYAVVVHLGGRNRRLHLDGVIAVSGRLGVRRLRRFAGRAGFGVQRDLRSVSATAVDARRVASYCVEGLSRDAPELLRGDAQRIRPVSYSRGWPKLPERAPVTPSAARSRLRLAQRKRRVRCVLSVAERHGWIPFQPDDCAHSVRRRLIAKWCAAMAERCEGDDGARAILLAAGRPDAELRAEGRAALHVGEIDPAAMDDALARDFPGWAPDVVLLAFLAQPALIPVWESHRRRHATRLESAGQLGAWPSFPDLPLDTSAP